MFHIEKCQHPLANLTDVHEGLPALNQEHHSSHPSPADSDDHASSRLPDSHSESSQISPASQSHSHEDFPQDLSLPKCSDASLKIEEADAPSTELAAVDENSKSPNDGDALFNGHKDASAAGLLQLNPQQATLSNSPGGGVKVFNLEAFCEICQKEFCNKYYLQTHKATKHGIPTMSGLSMVPSSLGIGGFGAFASHPMTSLAPMTSSSIGDFHRSSLTASSNGLDAQLRCPFCAQPCSNQLALQSHIMAFHNPLAPMGQPSHPLHALYMSQMMAGMSNGASPGSGHFGSGCHISSPLDFGSNPTARWLDSSPQAAEGGGSLVVSSAANGPSVLDRMQLMASGATGLFSPGQLPPGFVPPSLPTLNQAPTTQLSALAAALGQHPGASVLHQGQITPQPSTSAGVVAQDRSPINKEAYCELCEKEFCNKYFLRTHKQKKHGIYTEDTPQSASDSPSSRKRPTSTNGHHSNDSSPSRNLAKGSPALTEALQMSVIVANTQQSEPKQPKMSELLDVGGKPRSSLDSLLAAVTSSAGQQHGAFQCEVCTRVFPTYFTLATHKFREHSASLALPTTSAPTLTNSLHSMLASQQQLTTSAENAITPPRPTAIDPDSYCEICDKEFCSKYFLRQHRFNIHGIASSEDSPGPGLAAAGMQQLPNAFMLQQAGMTDATLPQHLQQQQQTPKPKRQYVTGKNYCDLCNKEVCNKYFLRTHMLKMHGIVIDENKTVIGNIDTLEKEKTGALSFRCDICLKEMNTRHLLRAHKQEAHGIVPLGTPPSQNRSKSTNANSVQSNGEGSQQRPTMISLNGGDSSGPPNVTVSSNSSLRMRDDSSPYLSYASFTEVCPVCDGRFKSTALLQSHMQREHANEVPAEILASFQKATEQAAQIKAEQQLNQLPCEFCPLAFDDIIEHQLHIINDHPNEIRAKTNTMAASAAMASFKQEGVQSPTTVGHNIDINRSVNEESVRAPESEEDGTKGLPLVINNNGKKLYRCSYCTYYTPWPSNLSTHEKRHTLGTPSSAEPHVCNVCLREYRYAHSLKRHKEVHRLGASYERKYGSPDKNVAESPENGHASTTVSPSKVAKRFRCTKCDKRFRTREQCREHLFAVHRRQELRDALANHSPNKDLYRAVADENQAAVSAVVESLHQQLAEERRNKEEHEHTSGSASPTSEKMMAEGYARPLGTAHLDKPFIVQTFVMRERCDNGLKGQFLHELIAHLPVRSLLSDPVEVTFELVPAPHIDAQVKHL